MEGWQIFILGVIVWQVLKMLWLATNDIIKTQRQKRFVALVHVKCGSVPITLIAVESSDKRALEVIKRDFIARFDLDEEETDEIFR